MIKEEHTRFKTAKYIDVDKLNAEIERLYNGEAPKHDQQCNFDDGYFVGIDAISQLIDSLQQEQLDIEKIKREWHNKGYFEGRKNAHIPARELGLPKSWDFQEEHPDVDLKKEIEDHSLQMPMSEFTHESEVEEFIEWAKNEFRHFYELGLNTKRRK